MTRLPKTCSSATCRTRPFMLQGRRTPTLDQIQLPRLTGPGTIASGVPVYGPSNCGGECDIFGVDRNIKTPYMENYNLNIQQQITSKVSVQIGYVGSQGHRLWRFFDINQPNQAQITAADCPSGIATCATTGKTPGFRRPACFFRNSSRDDLCLPGKFHRESRITIRCR